MSFSTGEAVECSASRVGGTVQNKSNLSSIVFRFPYIDGLLVIIIIIIIIIIIFFNPEKSRALIGCCHDTDTHSDRSRQHHNVEPILLPN